MIPKFDVLTQNEVENIHEHSVKILEEVGVEFTYDPAVEVLKKAGLKTEGHRVYFTREFIDEMMKKSPQRIQTPCQKSRKNRKLQSY